VKVAVEEETKNRCAFFFHLFMRRMGKTSQKNLAGRKAEKIAQENR